MVPLWFVLSLQSLPPPQIPARMSGVSVKTQTWNAAQPERSSHRAASAQAHAPRMSTRVALVHKWERASSSHTAGRKLSDVHEKVLAALKEKLEAAKEKPEKKNAGQQDVDVLQFSALECMPLVAHLPDVKRDDYIEIDEEKWKVRGNLLFHCSTSLHTTRLLLAAASRAGHRRIRGRSRPEQGANPRAQARHVGPLPGWLCPRRLRARPHPGP